MTVDTICTSEFDSIMDRKPKYCQVCTKNTAENQDAFTFYIGTKEHSHICAECYFEGILWSARQAREHRLIEDAEGKS